MRAKSASAKAFDSRSGRNGRGYCRGAILGYGGGARGTTRLATVDHAKKPTNCLYRAVV